MPVGYLVTMALVLWCTVLAVAPLRRPMSLARMSFWFGVLVNEQPFVAFYWLIASTVLAWAQNDLQSPGGWFAFSLGVLATPGLALVARRGLKGGAAVEAALAEGLGEGWRTAIEPGMAAGLRRRLHLARILLRPLSAGRHDVKRIANLRYGDAGSRNLLDVYCHRSRPAQGPVLVYLHGGGFVSGKKNREGRPLLHHLASRGWVCVSANYRLSPAARYPDHLIDVKKVIAWVREHGAEYGADPARVFVSGSSAGGHLASLAALTPGNPAFQPGFEDADTSVSGAIPLYGYYGPLTGDPHRSPPPAAHARRDAPPFFVVHGDKDTYVPVEGARQFVSRLREVSSSPVVYAELPGAQHSFDVFPSPRYERVIDGIEAFAAWVRSTRPAGPASPAGPAGLAPHEGAQEA